MAATDAKPTAKASSTCSTPSSPASAYASSPTTAARTREQPRASCLARAALTSPDRRADSRAHTHAPPPLSADQQLATTGASRQMDGFARASGRQCIQEEMRAHHKPGSPKLTLPGDTAQTSATTADMPHTLFSRKCLIQPAAIPGYAIAQEDSSRTASSKHAYFCNRISSRNVPPPPPATRPTPSAWK